MIVHIVQENTNKTEKAERSLRMENLTSFKTNCLGVSLELSEKFDVTQFPCNPNNTEYI